MTKYFLIDRLEFLITKNCNSHCRHCSVTSPETDVDLSFEDMEKLCFSIERIMNLFPISSIMTYGGEPLLFPDITIKLHQMFMAYDVPKRELITNGFFSKKNDDISKTIASLIDAGVNQIFLSVDAFHQEHIPIERIEIFIEGVLSTGFRNILLHPAWLVSKESDNEYNVETYRIIDKLKTRFGISVSKGNVVTPAGYSRKLLYDYYENVNLNISKPCGEISYTNSLVKIKNLRFSPNGNVNICRGLCIGNIFKDTIDCILDQYNPFQNRIISMLLDGGIKKLFEYLHEHNHPIDVSQYYGLCDLCSDCVKAINGLEQT